MVNEIPTMTDGNLSAGDNNQMVKDEKQDSSVELAYHNPHYFDSQNFTKRGPIRSFEGVIANRSHDTVARNYQSLNTTTMDYVSLYSRPGEGSEGGIIPNIQVGGKFYAVVNKEKIEQHVYTSLAK